VASRPIMDSSSSTEGVGYYLTVDKRLTKAKGRVTKGVGLPKEVNRVA